MAVYKRGRYYYWKNTGGITLYLGSETKTKATTIKEAIKRIETRKAKLEKDLDTLKTLLEKAE